MNLRLHSPNCRLTTVKLDVTNWQVVGWSKAEVLMNARPYSGYVIISLKIFFWMISSNMLIDFIHVHSISFCCHANSQPASWSHLFIKSSRWIRGTKNQGDDAGRDCAAFRAEECHRCSPKCNSVTSTWANNCPYILDKRPGNERSEITLPLPLMSRKGEKNKVLLSCGSGFE